MLHWAGLITLNQMRISVILLSDLQTAEPVSKPFSLFFVSNSDVFLQLADHLLEKSPLSHIEALRFTSESLGLRAQTSGHGE